MEIIYSKNRNVMRQLITPPSFSALTIDRVVIGKTYGLSDFINYALGNMPWKNNNLVYHMSFFLALLLSSIFGVTS